MQLNAQIINENFNSSPWESAKAATSVSEVTTDNGIWRVYNTEINIEQTGASPATNGALIFPKNSLTPNLDTRPYVDVPAIEKGGVKTIELLARYGGKASIYSQLEVQQLINQEWVKIGETSIDENNYNKPTRYIINVNDLSEDIRLRLYYNGDNASAAVRIHDVIVHAPSLGIAMNLEARNIQEDGFEIQWEHATPQWGEAPRYASTDER